VFQLNKLRLLMTPLSKDGCVNSWAELKGEDWAVVGLGSCWTVANCAVVGLGS
jgi:hypothetical protein